MPLNPHSLRFMIDEFNNCSNRCITILAATDVCKVRPRIEKHIFRLQEDAPAPLSIPKDIYFSTCLTFLSSLPRQLQSTPPIQPASVIINIYCVGTPFNPVHCVSRCISCTAYRTLGDFRSLEMLLQPHGMWQNSSGDWRCLSMYAIPKQPLVAQTGNFAPGIFSTFKRGLLEASFQIVCPWLMDSSRHAKGFGLLRFIPLLKLKLEIELES